MNTDANVVQLRQPKKSRVQTLLKPAAEADDVSAGDIRFASELRRDFQLDLLWEVNVGWRIWDGKRYALDRASVVLTLIKQTARRLTLEAFKETDPDRKEELLKFAAKYSHLTRARGALEFLKPHSQVFSRDLDKDAHLLNVKNGTIDLRSGLKRPHDRKDRITKLIDIEYDAEAEAPRWRRFLKEIFVKDYRSDNPQAAETKRARALLEYIETLTGYSFTAEQKDHILAILCGNGSNGKTEFTKVLLKVADEYGHKAPSTLLMKQYSDQVPTDVADLRGMRFVVASETDEDGRLNESRVKDMTGGEGELTGRHMKKDFIKFPPTHHLFLHTNHRPKIGGTDNGIWRRLKLIVFEVTFQKRSEFPNTQHPEDPTLEATLLTELPGILAWIVQGARKYYDRGLKEPEIVREWTKDYRREEDILADFRADCCDEGLEFSVIMKELNAVWVNWCEEQGIKPWKQNKLGRRLKDAGFPEDRENGQRIRRGLRQKIWTPEDDDHHEGRDVEQ